MDDSVGFRFHPTEQEIISYFLQRKMCSPAWPSRAIREVKNICKFEPWDLPRHSPLPPDDRVWYFFNVHSNRTSRTTNIGFWKVTGDPRPIRDKQGKKEIGYRRILVFHRGRHPNGVRTEWVLHEYRSCNVPSNKVEYTLFRLKKRSGDCSDTCNEASGDLAFDSRNHVAAASEVNRDLSEEIELLLHSNELDSNSLSQLFPSIQPERRTSCSTELHRNSPSELRSSIQLDLGTSSCSNGLDGNSLPAFFSSIQSEQGTSYSNVVDRNPLSGFFASVQSEQRTSHTNEADRNPFSAFFSSGQSEQRTSYSNRADRNPFTTFCSSVQSKQPTSCTNGVDCNPFSLFSSIQPEQRTSYSNGADPSSLSAVFSSIQPEQRTSYSNGFNEPWNFSDSHFNIIEEEGALMCSQWSDQDVMYVGDSSDAETDVVIPEGGQLQEITMFYNENVNSEEYWEIPTALAPNETSSFSVGWDQSQMGEFPTSPRTSRSQHMPKSYRVIQEKCANRRIEVQGKGSSKAVSEDEAREVPGIFSVHLVEEKNIEKLDEELQKMNQTSNAKSVRKIGSKESKGGGNNIKGSVIFSESPPLDHKTTPPIVYIGNMLVGLVVIIFFIREMASLH